MSSLENEIGHIKAIGSGAVSLVNTAIILTIVAVILSQGSQAPAVITAFFGWISWLIGQVIAPITGGAAVNLTSTPLPAGSSGMSQTSATGSNAGSTAPAASTTGTSSPGLGTGTSGGATLPPGWSSTYAPGLVPGATTLGNGTVVYGYEPAQ